MARKLGAEMTVRRYSELRGILEARQREVSEDVRGKIRDICTNGTERTERCRSDRDSDFEGVNDDGQEDVELTILQMKSETLKKIAEALDRLEDGTYGYCCQCGAEIAEKRLRALPFAVRCKSCEEMRETALQRERVLLGRRGSLAVSYHRDDF